MNNAAVSIEDFDRAMFSRLNPDIWPNQFKLPGPVLIDANDLRKGEPGWVRSSDLHWILLNGSPVPVLYDSVRVALVPQEGYDLEVRRESGGIDLHVMFETREAFQEWMNAPHTELVWDDFDGPGKAIGRYARILFRTDNY